MDKPINILDKDYLQWVKELCKRYRQSQVKAAVKVNHVVLQFYWELGKDICNKEAENKYGSKFYAALSRDLRNEMPDAEGLSERNLRYTKKLYQLYSQEIRILQQFAANSGSEILQQPAAKFNTEFSQQVANQLKRDIFSIPWGHHMLLIDKFLTEPQKALFYVQQVIENGWSRNVLHNYIDSSLYERQGKALSNLLGHYLMSAAIWHKKLQETHTILLLQVSLSRIMSAFLKMLCSTISPSSLPNWVLVLHT